MKFRHICRNLLISFNLLSGARIAFCNDVPELNITLINYRSNVQLAANDLVCKFDLIFRTARPADCLSATKVEITAPQNKDQPNASW